MLALLFGCCCDPCQSIYDGLPFPPTVSDFTEPFDSTGLQPNWSQNLVTGGYSLSNNNLEFDPSGLSGSDLIQFIVRSIGVGSATDVETTVDYSLPNPDERSFHRFTMSLLSSASSPSGVQIEKQVTYNLFNSPIDLTVTDTIIEVNDGVSTNRFTTSSIIPSPNVSSGDFGIQITRANTSLVDWNYDATINGVVLYSGSVSLKRSGAETFGACSLNSRIQYNANLDSGLYPTESTKPFYDNYVVNFT